MVHRQTHREEAGAIGRHIGGHHLGDLGAQLNGIDPHRIEGELGRGIPELAEGLRRHSVTGLAGEQRGGTAGHQLGQNRGTQPLRHQGLLTLLPVGGSETAEAAPEGEGQLFHPGQPFLGLVIPDLPQRRILERITRESPLPLRILGQQAGVRQAEEPAAVDLQGAQTVEQLLPLIHLRRWQAQGHLAHRLRGSGGPASSQPQPAQGRSNHGREHQGNQHGPEAPLSGLLLLLRPGTGHRSPKGGFRCRRSGGQARQFRPRDGGRADVLERRCSGSRRLGGNRGSGLRIPGSPIRRGYWRHGERLRGLGHQHHGAVGPGYRSGAFRHRNSLQGCESLRGSGEAAGGIAAEKPLDQLTQGRLGLQGNGHPPLQGDRIEQGGRLLTTDQHQGEHPQGMEIHPGGGRFAADQLRRGIAGRGAWGRGSWGGSGATGQAEIEQHRQSIAVAAQEVGGTDVAMEQVLAMEGHQHRQQLPQQQQHLAGTEHQLALAAGLQQLVIGAASLPIAHQPLPAALLDHGAETGHLGMEHPLQAGGQAADHRRIPHRRQLAQSHGCIGRQPVAGEPEHPLVRGFGEGPHEAVTAADRLAGSGRGGGHQPFCSAGAAAMEEASCSGCRSPRPSSQSRS